MRHYFFRVNFDQAFHERDRFIQFVLFGEKNAQSFVAERKFRIKGYSLAKERDRLQEERVAAYREYIADVRSAAFPESGHIVAMADADFEGFIDAIDVAGS